MTARFAKTDLATLWIAVLLGLTVGVAVLLVIRPPHLVGYDFQAFYCAGRAVLAGANPYLNQPLHACEAAGSPAFFGQYPNVTVPAPLPPYALALFAPLALLPFELARAGWWALLAGCVLAEARLIGRLSGRSTVFGLAACGFALTAPTIIQAALAPLPIVLVSAAALSARGGRWVGTAALLAAAMIEPHVALPACAAAFLCFPRVRLPLIGFGALCAALGLAAVGPRVFLAYFTSVLPVHALSELDNLGQDSLTTILHHLGAADALALHAGAAQYAAFALAGVLVGRALSKRYGDAAWAVLVPAAFAVVGGEFIHLSEIAMAIPVAALLAVRAGGWRWATLLLLSLPGEALINYGIFLIPTALVAAALPRQLGASGRVIVCASILAAALSAAGHALAVTQIGTLDRPIADPGPHALASVTWGAYNRLSYIGPTWWVEKACTLLPLLALIATAVRDALTGAPSMEGSGSTSSQRLRAAVRDPA